MEKINSVILSIESPSDNYKLIKLKPDNKLNFSPGQSIALHINDSLKYFSITSLPSGNFIEILVKKSDSKSTMLIFNDLKVNDSIFISGPFGNAISSNNSKDVTFVAGGSGIANFISFIRSNKNININLFYSVRNPNDLIFKNELEDYKNIKTYYIITSSSPRINQEYISKLNFKNDEVFFICGPKQMIVDINSYLINSNINKDRIIFDKY